jgi:type IV pilus assembly protein PilB
VLTEISAPDCAAGIVKLVELVGDAQTVAEGMRLIVSQKLVRTLCPACRQAFRPNPKLLSRVGLPKDTRVLYRRRQAEEGGDFEPCRKCGDLGFMGRTAMFEAIEFTDPIKEVVANGGSREEIKAAAREAGMLTFQKDGLRVVAQGKTSLDELKRAFRGS